MAVPCIYEIGMNLVGNDEYAVFQANVAHCLQFLFRPDASDGIVRIADDKQFYVVFYDPTFKILVIDTILTVFVNERTYHEFSPVYADGFLKRIIDGLTDKNAVPLSGKRTDHRTDRKHHAAGKQIMFGGNFPAVLFFTPFRDCLKVTFLRIGISENPVVNFIAQCVTNLFG